MFDNKIFSLIMSEINTDDDLEILVEQYYSTGKDNESKIWSKRGFYWFKKTIDSLKEINFR